MNQRAIICWDGEQAFIYDAQGVRTLPWICTACDTPCDLALKETAGGFKFLSACCTAQVRPTRTRDATNRN